MTEEEKELIEGCRAGDSTCQKQLYLQYGPLIKGICMRYAGNQEEMEDLFHDIFIFILINFKSFTKITSLGAWLRRITINKLIDHYRKKVRFPMESFDELAEEPNISEDPQELFQQEGISMDTLVGFINELPVKNRTAFNLFFIEGMDQAEIAQIMGESNTNVRTLVFRAKTTLQKKINQYSKSREHSL